MDFWQYRTSRILLNSVSPIKKNADEFYPESIRSSVAFNDRATYKQQTIERAWEADKCPYYRVYPSIIPMLLKLNLEVDTGLIRIPQGLRVFAIHFPKIDHKLSFDFDGRHYNVRSILCGPVTLSSKGEIYDGISIWVDFGETYGISDPSSNAIIKDVIIPSYINIPVKKGLTVEAASDMLQHDPSSACGVVMPENIYTGIIRLVCTICLLENDPTVIEPDVLDKDRMKYELCPDQKLVDRAIRRGKYGWNIGRKIEIMPHVRGDSPFALYWTGKGRTIPIIRHRKGCIVHRELVSKVSTIQDYDEQHESKKDRKATRSQDHQGSEDRQGSEAADHSGETGVS